jgi:hypothetical protein
VECLQAAKVESPQGGALVKVEARARAAAEATEETEAPRVTPAALELQVRALVAAEERPLGTAALQVTPAAGAPVLAAEEHRARAAAEEHRVRAAAAERARGAAAQARLALLA